MEDKLSLHSSAAELTVFMYMSYRHVNRSAHTRFFWTARAQSRAAELTALNFKGHSLINLSARALFRLGRWRRKFIEDAIEDASPFRGHIGPADVERDTFEFE